MKRPRIERVPDGYEPRYPKDLTRDEYRALIVPDQASRLAAAAAAASLGAALVAQDPGRPAEARTEAVLAVLSKTTTQSSYWFERTTFARGRDAQGRLQVIPSIPICFGNSQNGVFDAGRARALVRELFVAYGLKPAVDHRLVEAGIAAELDVYDAALQIGAELRGGAPKDGGMGAVAAKEPPAKELGDDELAALTKKGYRIHRADLDSYPLMDGDQLTPTVAYLASIVAFLNEVTGGPDVDLEAILDNHRARADLPDPAAVDGVRVTRESGTVGLAAEQAAEVTFRIDPGVDWEELETPAGLRGPFVWKALPQPPAPGRTLMLQLQVYPATPLRIEQDGARPIRIDAPGPTAFLPPRFDPRRPFTVTLKIDEGETRVMGGLALVGGR